MRADIDNLNDRLKWAVWHGDVTECRRLQTAGAAAPNGLSACDQAEWFNSAIIAEDHQMELVELLLEAGFDPNSVYDRIGEEYQQTPLVAAAAAARLDLMKRLAAAGANIHWRSPTGANAASEAMPCRSCQAPRVESAERSEVCYWLAHQGVRLDPHCPDSRRKLAWAASNPSSWPDIPLLAEQGVDISSLQWTSFMLSVASGRTTVEDVRALPAEQLELSDCYRRTPFLLAVAAGRQDLAEALLARGADLFAFGWCGATAMHLAAKCDQPEIIEWLAGLGFPFDVPDDHHYMPLRSAIPGSLNAGSLNAVRKLLALGADVSALDDCGYEAIHETTSKEVLELLLDAGANVNAISGGGCWPLKNVCDTGDAEAVQFLLNRGAQPDLTSTGETALFSAARSDSFDCVRLLLDAGADVNAQDVDGWTCLWCVRSLPMAQLLLERGADPSIPNEVGRLPETWGLPLEVTSLYRKARTWPGSR